MKTEPIDVLRMAIMTRGKKDLMLLSERTKEFINKRQRSLGKNVDIVATF